MIGKIVKHKNWNFPGIIVGEWPNGGFRATGFSKTGITANHVYFEADLKELSGEDFNLLTQHEVDCLIYMRDNLTD